MPFPFVISCPPHGDNADDRTAPSKHNGHINIIDHADRSPQLNAGEAMEERVRSCVVIEVRVEGPGADPNFMRVPFELLRND
jgi:hypothetical protein